MGYRCMDSVGVYGPKHISFLFVWVLLYSYVVLLLLDVVLIIRFNLNFRISSRTRMPMETIDLEPPFPIL